MKRFLRWLEPTGAFAWRWLSGIPRDGAPPTDAGRFTPGHRPPPPGVAPQLPSNLLAEIRWDVRQLRTEWRELQVRRALGQEFRAIERQILAERDAGEQ